MFTIFPTPFWRTLGKALGTSCLLGALAWICILLYHASHARHGLTGAAHIVDIGPLVLHTFSAHPTANGSVVAITFEPGLLGLAGISMLTGIAAGLLRYRAARPAPSD